MNPLHAIGMWRQDVFTIELTHVYVVGARPTTDAMAQPGAERMRGHARPIGSTRARTSITENGAGASGRNRIARATRRRSYLQMLRIEGSGGDAFSGGFWCRTWLCDGTGGHPDAVLELNSGEYSGYEVWRIDPAPTLLGGEDEFERHGQSRLARS